MELTLKMFIWWMRRGVWGWCERRPVDQAGGSSGEPAPKKSGGRSEGGGPGWEGESAPERVGPAYK